MQTHFSLAQLTDPHLAASEQILRSCVHCGFCTATCPTFTLLGDELDSPRGRIYLIKEMLENDRPADAVTVQHIDRCLSCLSCMTTCPSGVHYMHLVDYARAHITATYQRPRHDALLRQILAFVLPYPNRFRLALHIARITKSLAKAIPLPMPLKTRVNALLALVPKTAPRRAEMNGPRTFAPKSPRKARVALLTGCAQPVLKPSINEATIRLLNRLGVEVVLPKGEGCCGSLVHHMGREDEGLASARANVDAWTREIEGEGLDAIIVTASGCGTTIKDYGYMLRLDPAYAQKAAQVSSLAKDITEFLVTLEFPAPTQATGQVVAYHSACSMQHGQKIKDPPRALLKAAGFIVKEIAEGHLCCGSAGVYNILQSEIADQLRDRKLENIARVTPQLVATGNIGCITQLATKSPVPVVHTVELLDWAYGGPKSFA